jgi:riboflavin-specific deaminase-like protein
VRPYVLSSVAVSVDGYIDDTGPDRLLLSNDADFDRVDQVRSECDAILIGAETMRRDNPHLLVYNSSRRESRTSRGLPEYPVKVTVTRSGKLDPDLAFWHCGGDKLVYTTDAGAAVARPLRGDLADVVPLGPSIDFAALLDDLGGRGVGRLMVEGGGHVHTAFLSAGLVDEIQLAIAPLLVGQADAPRFLHPAAYPAHRMELADVQRVGDVVVLRYLPKPV